MANSTQLKTKVFNDLIAGILSMFQFGSLIVLKKAITVWIEAEDIILDRISPRQRAEAKKAWEQLVQRFDNCSICGEGPLYILEHLQLTRKQI